MACTRDRSPVRFVYESDVDGQSGGEIKVTENGGSSFEPGTWRLIRERDLAFAHPWRRNGN